VKDRDWRSSVLAYYIALANVREEQDMAGGQESEARQRWERRLAAARAAVTARQSIRKDLIEIAAQHPLVNGMEPGEEFAARLRFGMELYDRFRVAGAEVEIYVPGSRLMDNGIEDKISLSEAGTRFLLAHGVPPEVVHGDDLNDRYKGSGAAQPGVYCSADECFVAASYWRDGGFGRLVSVVSAGQELRKMLHFIEFGVYPLMYTVPTFVAAHSPVVEAFELIPAVLFEDASLQAADSRQAVSFRRARMPGYFAHVSER
jgi:hypothetical protein